MNTAPRFIVALLAALSIATIVTAQPARTPSSRDSAPGFRGGDKPKESTMQFAIHYSPALGDGPFDGRLLLLIDASEEASALDSPREPRFNFSDNVNTAQGFGIDVNDWRPGQPLIIDGSVFGYPHPSLADLPKGEYVVQAILHKYETFHRSDGHTVKLPMDRGEGQHWNRAPGNIYSTPMTVRVDPGSKNTIAIEIDNEIPPIELPADTHYIKHITIQSKMLTEFWGRPMHLGAVVLIPHGF
ncbi:MAG: hypothetical protein O7G85_07905, partial [Planctomycetota bacterium]|nr:hypothetical protein [Planctomycetota bacterium]